MPAIGLRCTRCGTVGAAHGLLAYCVASHCPRMLVLQCLTVQGWMRIGAARGAVA